ncbi:unnamed protein product, partial [marine sediment metagenome]
MVSTFNRGRQPDSLRRKQLTKATDLTRISVPNAFLRSAMTGFAVHYAFQCDLVSYIFERLSDGTVDKISKTETRDDGFDLDVM